MTATVITGQPPTNLGPLTTTFTPPAACTVAVGAGPGGMLEKNVALLGQVCSSGRAWDAMSCWPQASQGADAVKQAPLKGWGFYSPGLHCPVGYATACSATGGAGGQAGWPVQFQLGAGETAVGCCPSGYGCANIHGQTCTMVVTSATIPTVTCDGSKSGSFGFLTVPNTAASMATVSLFAPMIQINWRSTDRPEASPTPTPPPSPTSASIVVVATSGTKTIDTEAASGEQTLILAPGIGSGADASDADADIEEESVTPSQQSVDNGNGNKDEGLNVVSRVAIGAASTALLLAVVVCGLFYWWRRPKSKYEARELDRLYGMRHTMGPDGDFTSQEEMPGWHRGHRIVTPPTRYPGARAWTQSMRSVDRPPAPVVPSVPYYKPYRPPY